MRFANGRALLRLAYGWGIVLATVTIIEPGTDWLMSGIAGVLMGFGASGWRDST